ncbi:hypothetical protein K502DRAFT_66684 [Neoconidiobolus thromboides FSU 785]|nr:hypothetical protein K502DRAFT_66684 [Neoconidiobolus thromboides FSU 785]
MKKIYLKFQSVVKLIQRRNQTKKKTEICPTLKASSLNGTQMELLDSKNPSINSKEASKRAYSVPNINTKNSFIPQKRRMLSGSDFSTLNSVSLKSIEEVYENNNGLISGDSIRAEGLDLVRREGFLSHIPENQNQEDHKSDGVNRLETIGQEPKSMDSSLVDDADFNRIENFEIKYDQAPEAKNKNSVNEHDGVNTMKHEDQTYIGIDNYNSKDTMKNSNIILSADNCENNTKFEDNEIKDVIINNNIGDIDIKNRLLTKTNSNNKNDLEENPVLEATTKDLGYKDQDPKESRDCNDLEEIKNDVQNQNEDLTKPSNLNTLAAVMKSAHDQANSIKESTNLYAVKATENGDLENSSNVRELAATTKDVNNQNQDLANPSTAQIGHRGNTDIINKSQGYSSTNKSAKASNIFMLMSSNDFSPLPKVAEVSNIPASTTSRFVQEKQANSENKVMVEDIKRSDRTSLNNHPNNMASNGILGSENSAKNISKLGDGNDRPSKKGRSNKNNNPSFGIFKNEKTPNMLQTQNKDLPYENKEPLKHIKDKFNSTSDTKYNRVFHRIMGFKMGVHIIVHLH